MKTELLKKIQSLAERGIGGEKENANKLLNKLLDKYGVSIEELADEKVECIEFKYKNHDEEILLKQIIFKVTNSCKTYIYRNTVTGRKARGIIGADVTQAQKIEIEFLFDWYKNQLKKEHEIFLKAFIYKHEIYGVLDDDTDNKNNMSVDELLKMKNLINGMEDASPIRRIEGGDV